MSEVVSVPVPEYHEDDAPDLIEYFSEVLGDADNGFGEFIAALDCRPKYDDSRIELASIEITDVSDNGDSVAVYYDVEFSAYYGCSDVDGSFTDDGLVAVGKREGDAWVFPVQEYPERMSPNEEL